MPKNSSDRKANHGCLQLHRTGHKNMNQGGTKRQKENKQREQKTGQHGACGTRCLGGWMKQISNEMGGGRQGEQTKLWAYGTNASIRPVTQPSKQVQWWALENEVLWGDTDAGATGACRRKLCTPAPLWSGGWGWLWSKSLSVSA